MSSNIEVFVRCRPLVKSELNFPVPVEVYPEVNKILVRDTGTDKSTVKTFTYDKVFGPEATQAEIYSKIGAPLVQQVIQGFNCTIFAYGQTGTGKTFTIEGDRSPGLDDKSEDPLSGIIPRSMEHLFNELKSKDLTHEICVSFLELYNEEIFDLLSKYEDDFIKLKIYENSSQKGSVIVQGLEIVTVKSMKDVYDILDKGCRKRRKAVTLLNKASSRSHTIFTATVSSKESSATLQKVKCGKLNLVDLAGSENIGRSGAVNKRAREAGSINQSLLALGRVITSLCEKAGHIPYRESKLTRLLQDSLGGQTKTAVIATISPSAINVDETLNTLEYALRAKSITIKPELNAHVTVNSIVQDYLKKIDDLRTSIYKVGKDGLSVSEGTIGSWESTLAAKREEKFKLLSEVETLSEEDKALDATILQLQKRLEEKSNHLEKVKMQNEDYRIQMTQLREERKLHENMLEILEPMHDNVHAKFHKTLEEIKILEFDNKKKQQAVEEVLEEQRKARETLDGILKKHKLWNAKFLKDSEDLVNGMRNVNDSVSLMTTECKTIVSSLENGLNTRKSDCKKVFEDISKDINMIEVINNDFQRNIDAYLLQERTNRRKLIEDCEKELSSYKNIDSLESLDQIINSIESSIQSLSTSANEWKNEATSKMKNTQKIMSECKSSVKNTLASTAENVKVLLNKQKEKMEEFNNAVSDSLKIEGSTRKMMLDKFQAAEQAIASLDIFCAESNKNEIFKTNQAHSSLKNYLEIGHEIVEEMTNCSENCAKSIDEMHANTTSVSDISSKAWKDVKKANSAFARYKNLTEELDKLSKTDENYFCIRDSVRRTLKDLDESNEQLEVSEHVKMLADSVMKRGNDFVARMIKNQMEVEESLSKDKLKMENFVESSKRLSKRATSKMMYHHEFLETDLLERFPQIDNEETILRNEASFSGTDTIVSEKTMRFQNTVPEIPLQDFASETDCPVCSGSNFMYETSKPGENTSLICSDSMKGKQEIPGSSKSSLPSLPGSPISRPQCKNAVVLRKNLQFPDAEKLVQELFESSSEDEV